MNDSKSSRNRVASHIAEIPKSGIREFFDIVTTVKDVISLSIGEPDFVTPWHIREQAVFGLEKGHTSYTSNLGKLSLRKAICAYVEKEFGVSYQPESECLVTVGVSEALDLAFRAILNPGDEVIYHQPCYVSYPAEIAMAHGIPVSITTTEANGFRIDPADLRAAITPKTRAVLLNFPCNPTGAALDLPAIQALADIIIEHDLLVITDEIYSELTYGERPPSIAALPGMKDRTLFLHGFSKAFAMTGLRLGYACGPHDIIDAMMKIHQYGILCAPTLAQEAAEEALKNGRPAMEKMRDEYLRRRNLIVHRLNDIGLPCRMPEGAFYAFPSVAGTGLSARDFAIRLLQDQKVAAVPGTAFGTGGAGHIRCAFSTSIEQIKEAMDRLDTFVKSLKV